MWVSSTPAFCSSNRLAPPVTVTLTSPSSQLSLYISPCRKHGVRSRLLSFVHLSSSVTLEVEPMTTI
ncbi:hypothetical protein DTO006G1_2143 [Penicillium roqueforti]|uniref:uncharacterized protein n=1 Tax=Penicillium roqueforti TaxID=5082 RepID=UPI00190A6AC6|nr:uncharacterized protein LCP9604111_432 [Penicillium roqueforti]KAF9252906.1 hypothetical protein LCP9604111_432 [Penicillium roqueforti]KAI1832791.1 hypothetical protein CBS147337_6202 [Penicillium roqueforti]KAI2697842.1 hypothetical protein CBS147372_7414 [Penicillium roqueforti]KAI2721171.1 hypothetical protein CBS147354_5853 [Penicillium roqueforti]KAI2724081.1 hypothetical protein CBS147318_1012 [Penicillium roqueforti]